MSVVAEQLEIGQRWIADGRRVVCATLVDAQGSSPFEPGVFMLIDPEGAIEGSVTGGCVESDVVISALDMLSGDGAPRLVTYGVSDELAHTVGLMCGGTVEIFVHELRGEDRATVAQAFDAAASGRAVGIATLVDGAQAGAKLAVIDDRVIGGLRGAELLDRNVAGDLVALGLRGTSAVRTPLRCLGQGAGSEQTVHLHAFRPAPTLVLVGAIDYSRQRWPPWRRESSWW